jgi:putative component of membrane protein insertase Oxa1/YidC/SpoIIIJ protein YidD
MRHGILKGFIMGFARILRCSRWFYGGDDQVPETWSWKAIKDGYTLFRKRKSS